MAKSCISIKTGFLVITGMVIIPGYDTLLTKFALDFSE